MKMISASSFCRPQSNENANNEDGALINLRAGLFGVVDGNSAASSPKHPSLLYPGGLTGGQMATAYFCSQGVSAPNFVNAKLFLLHTNKCITVAHHMQNKSPVMGDDVGGACFALCKVGKEEVIFILAGDCFVLYKDKMGFSFLTGFDEKAFKVEEVNMQKYAKCLKQAGGNRARAWDSYWPVYRKKRIHCSNRNLGKGGYASLNGDPSLPECWSESKLAFYPEWILMGTDGLIPSTIENRRNLPQHLGRLYSDGGLPAIIKWRDENDYLPHIGKGNWPEATAIELKFGT